MIFALEEHTRFFPLAGVHMILPEVGHGHVVGKEKWAYRYIENIWLERESNPKSLQLLSSKELTTELSTVHIALYSPNG